MPRRSPAACTAGWGRGRGRRGGLVFAQPAAGARRVVRGAGTSVQGGLEPHEVRARRRPLRGSCATHPARTPAPSSGLPCAAARRWRSGCRRAGVSIQTRSAERSTAAVLTVRASGKLWGMTRRSRWRPRLAASLAGLLGNGQGLRDSQVAADLVAQIARLPGDSRHPLSRQKARSEAISETGSFVVSQPDLAFQDACALS